ncbi:MAG: hypothetical protein ACNS62_11450 [Candidatus Cyclobacteriaceae bacterium M3_2C_046]
MNSSIEQKAEEVKELTKDLKKTLQEDLNEAQEEASELNWPILIAGGAVLAGFTLTTWFFGKRKSNKKSSASDNVQDKVSVHTPKEESFLARVLKEQISMFVIFLLRKKVLQWMERYDIIDGKEDI